MPASVLVSEQSRGGQRPAPSPLGGNRWCCGDGGSWTNARASVGSLSTTWARSMG